MGLSSPGSLWVPVASKRFEADTDRWTVDGLDGDADELYRITVRHNNHADRRDNVRLLLNGDDARDNYEAVEAYVSASYSAGDRRLFDGLSQSSGLFERLWNGLRNRIPAHDALKLLDPGWRVLRERETPYMNFGKPLPGENAVFGQGHLLAASGGPRSLIRQCAETHPKGNLLTVGRYTYTNESEAVSELHFSSGTPRGIGSGSFILVETLASDASEWLAEDRAGATRSPEGSA